MEEEWEMVPCQILARNKSPHQLLAGTAWSGALARIMGREEEPNRGWWGNQKSWRLEDTKGSDRLEACWRELVPWFPATWVPVGQRREKPGDRGPGISKPQGSCLTEAEEGKGGSGTESESKLSDAGLRMVSRGWGETTSHAWKGLSSILCLRKRGTDRRDAIKEKLLLKIPLVPKCFVIR